MFAEAANFVQANLHNVNALQEPSQRELRARLRGSQSQIKQHTRRLQASADAAAEADILAV